MPGMRRFPPIAALTAALIAALLMVLSSACGGAAAPDDGDVFANEQDLAPPIEFVSPGIWRGRRPDTATLKQLKSMGVKTVLDLEDSSSAIKSEKANVKTLGMAFISEPMSGFWAPDDNEVNQIEAIMADQSRR